MTARRTSMRLAFTISRIALATALGTFVPGGAALAPANAGELTQGSGDDAPMAVMRLEGKAAPDANLRRLDEGEFRLKDQFGQRIVMLDFWATWCGPCVKELPILAEVAQAYKDKGVIFCAVNLRETPDEIVKFQKERKLEFLVGLDSKGEVGADYKIEAIPTLLLIDKKGVVRRIHIGYDPEIKATLHAELDALLAGKDLPKMPARDRKPARPKDEGVEQAWTISGPYFSVATDTKGRAVYAVRTGGQCDVLDPDGNSVRSLRLSENRQQVARLARLPGGGTGLFTFNPWGRLVLASKDDGTKLWEVKADEGVNDVWAADLDGDGVDEAIVGYNGEAGLHVFSSTGKRLWSCKDATNVWRVTAGDSDGDGRPEVVTASAEGRIHLFAAADGKPLRSLDAGLDANMVRTAPGRSLGLAKGDVVLAVGTASAGGEAMTALAGDGKNLWTLKFPEGEQRCESLSVSPDGAWAAVGLHGGRVCVVDVARGRIIAQVSGQGSIPRVGWTVRTDPPGTVLLVATGTAINAFQVKPVVVAADGKP